MGRLTVLEQIAQDIAAEFGNDCEVVIHDLKTKEPEHSIIYIVNGHVTGRNVGDGPSDAVFDGIRQKGRGSDCAPVHSLVNSLVRHPGNEFYFISPEELKIPDYVMEETLKPNHSFYKEVTSLEETLPKLDVLYMTRVQKERFFNEEDYVRLKDTYILNREKLNLAQPDMPVLHPLPRVDEIATDVDQDPRAAYFDQVQNGKYIRMALIMALLEIPDPLTGRTVL